MSDPSKDWTEKERLDAIFSIVDEIDPPNGEIVTDRRKIHDVSERVRFIATLPAEFLEANREAVLGGQ